MKKLLPSTIAGLLLIYSVVVVPPLLTGCRGSLKPVPVAEGSDPVVVNAERIQRSSLAIYDQVTAWELAHRSALPKEASQAVDAFRREFPPAWRLSRQALADYKSNKVSESAIDRTTAALAAAQSALLSLRLGQSQNEVDQAQLAISTLINAIRSLAQ